jgi:predicted transcriptional regulator
MAIVITLSPELETLLIDRATRQGQEVNLVASELLAGALEWQEQDSAEAVEGIQRGLDDFEVGRFRDFQEFAEEQRLKYNLPADS